MDNTIIVLTSDHGEEFADHSPNSFYSIHGNSLYDEMLHVPLIFRIPGNFPKGKRLKFQTRLVDIMPTLLDLVNIKYDVPNIEGTTLLPFMQGEGVKKELIVFSEAQKIGLSSLRSSKLKYITGPNNHDELYNLIYDPEEKHNIQASEPRLSSKLKNEIRKIIKKAKPVADKILSNKKNIIEEIEKEKKKQLKALGYIQ